MCLKFVPVLLLCVFVIVVSPLIVIVCCSCQILLLAFSQVGRGEAPSPVCAVAFVRLRHCSSSLAARWC